MNVGLLLTSPQDNRMSNADLPENQHQMYAQTSGNSVAVKTAINVGIRMGQQYITKSLTEVASLYGDTTLKNNINAGANLAGYALQIASGGAVGVAMVGAEIAYSQIVAGIKDRQAINQNEYVKSTVGYISQGSGRYK